MKNKQAFVATLAMVLLSIPLFSATQNPQKNPKKPQPKQQLADDMMMPQEDCSNMSQQERDFADKLNDTNAEMFCSKMSPSQRQKAMQMAGKRGSDGTKMSPDDAVQNVMRGSMGGNGKQRSSGACPVQ